MESGAKEELEGVPEPGSMILGKYRVERVLGVGGMGCVVAARHVTLDQHVAIKFLLSTAAKNPKNLQRFQREAQAAAKIKSDHVAKVSDVGSLDDGTPYMVMEYLDGEDLSDRLTRVGRVPVADAVSWVLQACEALAEAHQAGIVHRDLKPANLYLARQPDGTERVKVLDFGISKMVTGGQDLTRTSALMGSPLYMSPEQMMSAKAADHRTDIWALGCILFEALSGQPPFIGETLPEICSKILTSPPTPLLGLAPHVPQELAAIIDACLAKKPEDRFQNLGALSVALASFGPEPAFRSASRVCTILGLTDDDIAGMRPSSLPQWNPPPGFSTSGHTRPPLMSQPDVGPHGLAPRVPSNPGPDAVAQTVAGGFAAQPAPPLPPGAGSTAAPVAQTMDDGPRRSRAPLVIAALFGVLLLGAGGAYLGFGGADPAGGRAAAQSDEAGEKAGEKASEKPAEKAGEESNREVSAPEPPEKVAEAAASASAVADPAKTAAPTATVATTPPVAPRPAPVVQPPPPPPVVVPTPKPTHHVKEGDDLFN